LPGREALGHKDPDRLPNHALARLTYRNLELLGGPQWDPDAVKFCQELQQNLGLEPMAQPILDEMIDLCPPEKGETQLRALLPSWQLNYTSDDYVDWTWHTPTVRLIVGRCTLKPPADYDYPSWSWNALGGYSSTIDPTIICAAKTIAATTVDLLTQPEQLEKVRNEFNDRTGGGIHGTKWVPPLLPGDFDPPTGFHWPEYVTTARGHEWYIPRWRLERKHHGRQMRSAGSCPLRQQMNRPWS
jgi:aminobenzoyl-glutamate utilization protein B